MTAPPPIAQRILQRLQKLSEPFGTTIAIEGNVGVIRMAAQRPTSQP
jgi:poly-gamma-glutamate synthesis protein (capsule biosynthesis protein)